MSKKLREIGARIRATRHAREWTLVDLSRRARVSKGFLSDVEAKGRNFSVAILLRLARALNVSVEYIVIGVDEPPHEDTRP